MPVISSTKVALLALLTKCHMWQHWVNFVLALWVGFSAYLNMSAASMVTNLTVVGIVMAVLAIWGALEERTYHYRHEHMHA